MAEKGGDILIYEEENVNDFIDSFHEIQEENEKLMKLNFEEQK